jgi:hypothetical protein
MDFLCLFWFSTRLSRIALIIHKLPEYLFPVPVERNGASGFAYGYSLQTRMHRVINADNGSHGWCLPNRGLADYQTS